MPSLSRTRQDVWVFLALLALFSSVFYALVLLRPHAARQWSVYAAAFMWCPGMAAIVTCLVRDGTLRGLGWRWGRTRFYPIAYGLALAVCLFPYVAVWSREPRVLRSVIGQIQRTSTLIINRVEAQAEDGPASERPDGVG